MPLYDSILLQGGTLLVHDDDNNVVSLEADLLVKGNIITRIESSISVDPTSNTHVIDCSNKIVSPGFIDTHHHLWQTQLRGSHADHSLLDYMPTGGPRSKSFPKLLIDLPILGNLVCSFFTPLDIFWGQLGGALEALDAGTTTVVDHAHMNYSEEHSTYS
jgi:cytosine/adenosine deaminase-related metal-dependent hydrolase